MRVKKLSRTFLESWVVYGRQNLFSNPMQIFNLDESCISTVHKPGRVSTENLAVRMSGR